MFKGPISDNVLEEMIESFSKNQIIGASLRALGDKKWEHLSSSFHLWASVFTAERQYQRKSKKSKQKT